MRSRGGGVDARLSGGIRGLVIDGPAWEVRLCGTAIDLTRTEFEILLVLASQPRRVVTDDEIVAAVWGEGWFGDENNLAVHVSKLRHKLGESGLRPRYIRTVRGVGYRFDPHASPVPGPRDALTTHEHVCEGMVSEVRSVEVRTDGQLRVVSVMPVDAPVLGHDPRDLLGRYFPFVDGHPWGDHASALEAVDILIASGVREWTARHVVLRADGTSVHADVATCIKADEEGRLAELRVVRFERDEEAGGGGGIR